MRSGSAPRRNASNASLTLPTSAGRYPSRKPDTETSRQHTSPSRRSAASCASRLRASSPVSTHQRTKLPGCRSTSWRIVPPQPISKSSAWAPMQTTRSGPAGASPSIVRKRIRIPHLPGCLAGPVHLLEELPLLEGVHARPEPVVLVGEQLPGGDQALERLDDELFSRLDVVEHVAAKCKETAVDPHIRLADMAYALHEAVVLEIDEMERPGRFDRDKRAHFAAAPEPVQVAGQGEIRHAVRVVHQERFLSFEVATHRHQPLADIRGETGIDEGDPPVVDIGAQQLDVATAPTQDEVVRHALVVVAEVPLDHVSAIPEAQDEILVSEMGVIAHDVPQHRPVADLHHRFGHAVGLLADPQTLAPAEKDDLHNSLAGNEDTGARCCSRRSSPIRRSPGSSTSAYEIG